MAVRTGALQNPSPAGTSFDRTQEPEFKRYETPEGGFIDHLGGVVSRTIDTTSASLGFTDVGDIVDGLYGEDTDMAEFMRAHKDGHNLTGGIAMAVATGWGAGKVLKIAGGLAAPLIRASVVGTKMAKYAVPTSRLTELASKMAVGAAARTQTGRTTMEAVRFTGGLAVGKSLGSVSATLKARAWGKGLAWGATAEGMLAITQNENDMFYVDSMATNMAWAALGIAIPGGFERIAMGSSLKKLRGSPDVAAMMEVTAMTNKTVIRHTDGIAGKNPDRGVSIDMNDALELRLDSDIRIAADTPYQTVRDTRANVSNSEMVQAVTLANRGTTRGIPGLDDSGFAIKSADFDGVSDAATETWMNAWKANTTLTEGVVNVGKLPPKVTAVEAADAYRNTLKGDIARSQKVLKNKKSSKVDISEAQIVIREADWKLKNTEALIMINGEKIPVHEYANLHPGVDIKISRDKQKLGSILVDVISDTGKKQNPIRLMDDGRMILSDGRALNDLKVRNSDDFQTIQGLYAGMGAMVKKMKDTTDFVLTLPNNPDRFQLDLAEELLRVSKNEDKVAFPKGMTRDSALGESLAQKFEHMKKSGLFMKDGGLFANYSADAATRHFYNLPTMRTAEQGLRGHNQTFVDYLFRGVKDANEIRSFNGADLRINAATYRKSGTSSSATNGLTDSLTELGHADEGLSGSSISAGLTKSGKAQTPIMFIQKNLNPESFTRANLDQRIANELADVYAGMTKGDSSVGRMLAEITGDADAKLVANGGADLIDAAMSGRKVRALATRDMLFRDHPTLAAAARIHETASRRFEAIFKEHLESTGIRALGEQIRTKPNRAESQLLDQIYTSLRGGWEMDKALTSVGAGKYGIKLLQSGTNKTRWEKIFGVPMPENAMLPMANGKHALVGSMGKEFLEKMKGMTDFILREQNTMLRATGRSLLQENPFYVVPVNFTGKHVGFIVDPNTNKALQTVVAGTADELDKHVAFLLNDKKSLLGSGRAKYMSQTEIENFVSTWSVKGVTGLNDASLAVVHAGQKNKGASLNPFIESGAWQNQILGIRKMYKKLGNDVIDIAFMPQLTASSNRSNALNRSTAQGVGKSKDKSVTNIHDMFRQALRGQAAINDPSSILGGVYKSIEKFADTGLAALSSRIFRWESNPFSGTAAARREFTQLAEEIGQYMPFNTVDDFIQSKVGTRAVITSKDIVGKLNYLTASMMLRWGEIAHPILTMGGMVANLPGVMKWMTPLAGESTETFAKRIGQHADIFKNAAGKDLAVPSMTKMLMNAARELRNPKNAAAMKYRVRMGYMAQDVAEFNQAVANLSKRDDWTKFFNNFSKYAAVLSDSSENLSRSYTHMVGVQIAEGMGITRRSHIERFAHDFANRNIANYSPLNRPMVYQGTVGAPIGLFQSFAQQWYSNMYAYIENRAYKNMAVSMAMQFGMFGAVTVPGFKAFNAMTNQLQDGKTNLYDGIYKAYGQEVGDVVSSGVLSNIPKIFDAPGVALYTRGDMTPRLPGASPLPGIQMIGDIYTGLGEAFGLFQKGHPDISHGEVLQIFAHALSNRPISGLMQVLDGAVVDGRGNMIRDLHWNSMEAIYKVMGFASLEEAKQREAMWMNQTQNQFKAAQRSRLMQGARAMFRSGDLSGLGSIFEEHISTGGDPAMIPQLLEDLMMGSGQTKQQQQMLQMMKSTKQMNQLQRLMDAKSQSSGSRQQ